MVWENLDGIMDNIIQVNGVKIKNTALEFGDRLTKIYIWANGLMEKFMGMEFILQI